MNRIAILGLVGVAAFSGMIFAEPLCQETSSKPSQIEGHGKVTRFPDAREQPRDGSKIVVDLTAGGPHDQINQGLEKVARFVNIYSQAGKVPAQATICVVLHGDATAIALNDAAYADAFKSQGNPNLTLLAQLRKAGVEFFVCGQALTIKGYQPEQTTETVDVAVSGLTALVNRQQDGYAYVPLSK